MSQKSISKITWDMVDEYIRQVEKIIGNDTKKNRRKYSGIYGIPRGGLILAVMLSHRIKLPMLMHPANRCILIDDIYDSGKTIHAITQYSKPSFITTLAINEPDSNEIHYCYFIKSPAEWAEFPWEVSLIKKTRMVH